MSVIGLIIGLLFCAAFAIAIVWATQAQHPLLDSTAEDDIELREKPKHRLSENGNPFDSGIRDLIRAGRSQDAARIYQEFTGTTPEEASEEITRLEWEELQNTSHHSTRR